MTLDDTAGPGSWRLASMRRGSCPLEWHLAVDSVPDPRPSVIVAVAVNFP